MADLKTPRKKPGSSAEVAKTPAKSRKPTGTSVATASTTPRTEVAAQLAVAAKAKHKLIRDSFTIPKAEYSLLEGLKERATNLKRPIKKSELLRAGIAALHAMSDKAFLQALNGVTSLKTGRPKGNQAIEVQETSTRT